MRTGMYFRLNVDGSVREVAGGEWTLDDPELRTVAHTTLNDGTEVSTVFLGINHGFHVGGPPVLWETMVFWGPGVERDEEIQERYTSREDAQAGHDRIVAELSA